jgi:hypothetical protein
MKLCLDVGGYFLTVIAPIFLCVRFKNMVALLNACVVYKYFHIGVLARYPVEQSNPISFFSDITKRVISSGYFSFASWSFATRLPQTMTLFPAYMNLSANANPITAAPPVLVL